MLTEEMIQEIIEKNRKFTKGYRNDDPIEKEFQSDQELKKPQPPLAKAAVTPVEEHIMLNKDFENLEIKNNLVDVIRERKSSRIFTQENMSLEQLSFLLWATQGVKEIRGKSYATIRTVPCGGARHQFETYLLVRGVEGLENGAYHYLPLEHSLEFLGVVDDMERKITESMCGQGWAAKANVVFYWSMVPYRVEWRYGIFAHRAALIDVGHVGQNLYLACTGLGVGCCAIASFEDQWCTDIFGLDGEEEYVVYAVPVGTV